MAELFVLVFVICHCPNQGWESTHKVHLSLWVVSFTPPGIEHQIGGTLVFRLFQRTMESHGNEYQNPDWTAILVGDFNFPSISWKDLHCNSSNLEANTFKQTALDCYMTQHIDFPTRARGTDNPSCLDYIFTNSEELINNVLDTSPLGNSDHTVIQADINVKVTKKQKPSRNTIMIKGTITILGHMWRKEWTKPQIPKTSITNGITSWTPSKRHRINMCSAR